MHYRVFSNKSGKRITKTLYGKDQYEYKPEQQMAGYPVGCFIREYEVMFYHIILFYSEVSFPFSDFFVFHRIFYGLPDSGDE
jgi:hypothetical protein